MTRTASILTRSTTLTLLLACFAAQALAQSDGATEPEPIDPDVPSFAKTSLTKEEFMLRRAEGVAVRRGLQPGRAVDPRLRTAAIRQLERQEIARPARLMPFHSTAVMAAWTEIGPSPIPNGQTSPVQTAVSGRVTSIAVHPTNPDIVYAGAAQGGLYRSLDGGATWQTMLDGALSLAIGAVEFAPSDPTIVYVGTGEPHFSIDSFFGVGLYRIDGADGVSPVLSGPFNQDGIAADVFTGRAISSIQVHPTDPDILFAATTSGIGGIGSAVNSTLPPRGVYRCVNATAAAPVFEKLSIAPNPNLSVRDIVLDPQDPDVLIVNLVANGGGIYHTPDALAPVPTFTNVETFNSSSTSQLVAEFAVHPSNPTSVFYAATGNGGGRVLRSIDGGLTWTQRIDNNFCGGQCFYDIAIAVDPLDADRVYLGGDPTLIFGTSINGATSFSSSSNGVHADTHVITAAPSNGSVLYMGTDGGVYKSTNQGATWVALNNGDFRATQFMGLAVHPSDPNFTIGGTQDNGTNMYRPDATWNRVDFGDGGYAVIDQNAADVTNVRMYHTYFNASSLMGYGTVSSVAAAFDGNWSFRGCLSGGATANGITCSGSVNFYAPLEQGPGNPNTIYYGTDRLYRSADQGVNHTVVSQNPVVSGVPISAIGIAPTDDDVRVVGLNNGGLFGTTTGSATLDDLDPLGDVPNAFVSRVVIDPGATTTAYVALSAFGITNVWKTLNLGVGAIWTASAGSGGTELPQVPVNALVVDPMDSDYVYAGTDIGVYFSSDGGASWTPFGTGLPRVAVFDMALTANHDLRIATHGRGMWQTPAFAPPISVERPVLDPARPLLVAPQPLRLPGQARIAFATTAAGATPALRILDLAGRLVRELQPSKLDDVRREATWDGRDQRGREVAPGMYLVSVGPGGPRATTRLVVVR